MEPVFAGFGSPVASPGGFMPVHTPDDKTKTTGCVENAGNILRRLQRLLTASGHEQRSVCPVQQVCKLNQQPCAALLWPQAADGHKLPEPTAV
jgi:hypothetical protein